MICCDSCDEWFHYDCVSINSQTNDGNVSSNWSEKDFMCPRCCYIQGKNYQFGYVKWRPDLVSIRTIEDVCRKILEIYKEFSMEFLLS